MNASRVFQSARRSNFNKLVIGILVLILVIVGVYFTQLVPYFTAQLQPPQELSARDLRNIDADQLPLYNVRVTGDEMFGDVYYTYTEINGLIEVDRRNFGVLSVDNRFLMVESSLTITENVEATGVLYAMPDEVKNNVLSSLIAEVPESASSFLPLLLTNVVWTWWVGLAFAVGCAAFALNNIVVSVARYLNSERHPVVQRLGRYGYVRDVAEDVASDINQSGKKVVKAHMGKTWLVYYTSHDFSAVKWSDITNYTKGVTVGRYNSKKYAVHVYTKFGDLIVIPAKEKKVDEMLAEIALRVPKTASTIPLADIVPN